MPLSATDSPLTFNFIPIGNLADMLAGNQGPDRQALGESALNGFHEAGDLWRQHLRDPITVNIQIDFGPVGLFILGSSLTAETQVLYQDARPALQSDASVFSPYDSTAVAHLQPGPELDFVTNDTTVFGSAPRVRDNDAGLLDDDGNVVNPLAINNAVLSIARANAKAIGLLPPHDSEIDSVIMFTDFTDWGDIPEPFDIDELWDFGHSTGSIGPLSFDFVGVAAHEIGHALGFLSGVDIVDLASDPNGPFGPTAQAGLDPPEDPYDLNYEAYFSILDLYRYSQDSLSQPNQPATGGVLDLALGESVDGDRPYFSIDGGSTNLAPFSTGEFNGDFWQASHWQGLLPAIGMMAPGIDFGQLLRIRTTDLVAFDVIGYDPVPEPMSVTMLIVGLAVPFVRRSRTT